MSGTSPFFAKFLTELVDRKGGLRVEVWARANWRESARHLGSWEGVKFKVVGRSVTNKAPIDLDLPDDLASREGALAKAYVYDGDSLLWETDEVRMVGLKDGLGFFISLSF